MLSRIGRRLIPRVARRQTWPNRQRYYSTDKTNEIEGNVVESRYPNVEIPHITLPEFVWENMDRWLDRTAVEGGVTHRSYTYRHLREKCRRFSVSLRHMGFKPGSTLGIIMPNSLDYPIVVLGALEAGMIVSLINSNYLPGEYAMQILGTRPSVLVCVPENYLSVMEAVRQGKNSGYDTPPIIVAPSETDCSVPAGTHSYIQMTSAHIARMTMPRVAVNPCSTALIVFTRGTTDVPKGIALTHRNLIANNVQLHSTPEVNYHIPTTETQQDVVATLLPFDRVYGLQNTCLGPLRLGAKVVTIARFSPPAYLNMLRQQRATVIPTVFAIIAFLVAMPPELVKESLKYCRIVISGSTTISPQKADLLHQVTGRKLKFVTGYGLSECSPVICMSPPHGDDDNLMSVGGLLPNTRAKVVHLDTGENLGAGEMGELCFKGPQCMAAYYSDHRATQHTIDKNGWLHSGDVGYYDTNYEFFIVDRIQNLIKVEGVQVSTTLLENHIRPHPDVLDVAIVGVPCPQKENVLVAFVVPKNRKLIGDAKLEASVQQFVKEQRPHHEHLKEVRTVARIPKNLTGDTLHKLLRSDAANERVCL